MRVQPALPPRSVLRYHKPENLLVIENVGGGVIIRATRDNFSARRKAFFIRHLAAEGYIPDRFEKLYQPGCDALSTIRWIIDPACLKPSVSPKRQTGRFMWWLLLGTFVLWLALMVLLFLLL